MLSLCEAHLLLFFSTEVLATIGKELDVHIGQGFATDLQEQVGNCTHAHTFAKTIQAYNRSRA